MKSFLRFLRETTTQVLAGLILLALPLVLAGAAQYFTGWPVRLLRYAGAEVPVARWQLYIGAVFFLSLGVILRSTLLRQAGQHPTPPAAAVAPPSRPDRPTSRRELVWIDANGFKWKISPEILNYDAPASSLGGPTLDTLVRGPFCPTCLRQRMTLKRGGYSPEYEIENPCAACEHRAGGALRSPYELKREVYTEARRQIDVGQFKFPA